MLNFYFYRGQVRDYLAATGTPLGLIVFLTSNRIGIGAAVTGRPLPHHRTCGSASGGSVGLSYFPTHNLGSPSESK